MNENLIEIRRSEIEAEIARLQERIKGLAAERNELDIAERVLARLSGAKQNPSQSNIEPKPSLGADDAPKRPLTVRQMIMAALMDARQKGLPGRTPKQIREYVEATYERKIGQQINTTASRMWHDLKEIEKDIESGLFRLPLNETPVDEKPGQVPSTGLYNDPVQGRSAGPGGAP
ncbi:MAG: hypothetical protein ABJG86_03500 [Nitratireductor sp.]